MKHKLLQYLPIILLVWAFFAQLSLGSLQLSMTSDEPPHLISGYVMLTTGDAWGIPIHGHPPLLNAWSAWPILLQPERPDPREVTAWHQDWIRFVRAMWPLLGPIDRLAFITRVPIMLLGVALMALVYRWASDWFGHWGGVLAVAVMAWDPNMIAYSQLDTTDLGLTLFAFASLYLIQRLLRRSRRTAPPWRLLIGVGLLLGGAMATKPSGLMLAPVVIAMLGWGYVRETGAQWWAWLRQPGRSPARLHTLIRAAGRWIGYSVLALSIGGLALWACYRFEWSTVKGLPVSLPLASHIRMLSILVNQKDRLAFLNGGTQVGRVVVVFPVCVRGQVAYSVPRRGWSVSAAGRAPWMAIDVGRDTAVVFSRRLLGHRDSERAEHWVPAHVADFALYLCGTGAPGPMDVGSALYSTRLPLAARRAVGGGSFGRVVRCGHLPGLPFRPGLL